MKHALLASAVTSFERRIASKNLLLSLRPKRIICIACTVYHGFLLGPCKSRARQCTLFAVASASFCRNESVRACRYIEEGEMKTDYPIIIGGENFGCGSSREHAPVSLGASGGAVMDAASVAGDLRKRMRCSTPVAVMLISQGTRVRCLQGVVILRNIKLLRVTNGRNCSRPAESCCPELCHHGACSGCGTVEAASSAL